MYDKECMQVFVSELESYINDTCTGEYSKYQIPDLEVWLQNVLLPFACSVKCPYNVDKNLHMDKVMIDLKPVLLQSLYQIYSKVRAKEMFDIAADFPDSMVAIKELKDAANASSSLGYIGKVFRPIVKRRLLHTGASTSQILDFFILMIRSLRVLDPSDLLLNYVAAPVRTYLMSRKDTVRSIVSSLTEGKHSELHGELRKGGPLEYGADEDDEDGGPGETWMPRKRDPDLLESGTRGLDVLALLVSIYGSTDLFASEYRTLLADKLLSNLEYNTDQEVATLELLKIRFGEEPLHSCEVMLRDIEDSRRVNNAIISELRKAEESIGTIDFASNVVDYAILSDNYWPSLPTDAAEAINHPKAQALLNSYENTYANLKKPRKLHSIGQMGHVALDLTFDDNTTRTFTCLPIQATLILHLEEASPKSLEDLSTVCELEEEEVRRRMVFWIIKGVCREVKTMNGAIAYEVIEDQAANAIADQTSGSKEDYDDYGQIVSSSEAQEKAALLAIEGYIKGMLSGHDSMSLERIHSLLKLVASGGSGEMKYDMNMVQLRRFLQSMVDSDKIEMIDGLYRSIKKGR